MQAVIALCHFCEKHGPRVVITCQPMRNLPNPITSPTPSGYDRSSEGVNLNASTSNEPSPLPLFYGDCTRGNIPILSRCGACTSFGESQCLLSNDHQNKTSYVSSQTPLNEEVNKRLLKACVRSLTCEIAVPPVQEDNRSAAMRIGTSNDALPDIEKIKEEEGHVSFGDMEMGMCLAFRFRIHDSKARGRKRLFSLVVLTQDASSLSIHFDFFLHALRKIKEMLQQRAYEIFQEETDKMIILPHQHASVNITHLDKLIRTKVEIDPTRTLQVLTGHMDMFDDLHRLSFDANLESSEGSQELSGQSLWIELSLCMMWTLRTQTLRFEDQIMGGTPTQDVLVLMEMEPSDIVALDLDQPNQAELTLNQLRNLRYICFEFLKRGAMEDLDILIVHTITGGQLIVQSTVKQLAKQFILALSNLLPIGCLRVNNSVDRQFEGTHYNYNMLGGNENIFPTNVLRIQIEEEDHVLQLNKCHFRIIDRPLIPAKFPKAAYRFKELLLDGGLTAGTLKATMNATRDEWLNKAKLLYQLEQQAMRDTKFRENTNNNVLPLVVPATEDDRSLLKFWQNGLANSYRLQVIETILEHNARRQRN